MKLLKKAIIGSALALAFSAAQASPITVGGVKWDPDYASLSENDFLAQFDFTQWYGNTSDAVGAIPQVSDAVNIGTVLGSLNPLSSAATGYYLKGVGEVYRVNGTTGSTFCPSCELTYAFGGIGLNKDQSFDITNAWARMYVSNLSPDYTHPLDNQTEANDAASGSTWLDFKFNTLKFTSGAVDNGIVSAKLEIVGGSATANFQPNTLSYSAGAFFSSPANPNPKYSGGGNGAMIGNSIPEPGSLALFGLGLLGAAGAVRRRKA